MTHLKELIKRNMTMKDAADKLNISRGSLYNKLNKRTKTSLVERRKLAKIMQLTVKELERMLEIW